MSHGTNRCQRGAFPRRAAEGSSGARAWLRVALPIRGGGGACRRARSAGCRARPRRASGSASYRSWHRLERLAGPDPEEIRGALLGHPLHRVLLRLAPDPPTTKTRRMRAPVGKDRETESAPLLSANASTADDPRSTPANRWS